MFDVSATTADTVVPAVVATVAAVPATGTLTGDCGKF